jgi:hypothetical protein
MAVADAILIGDIFLLPLIQEKKTTLLLVVPLIAPQTLSGFFSFAKYSPQ